MNYYEMSKEDKNKARQAICDRAYFEIPNDGKDYIINLGFGIGMGIINSIQNDAARKEGEILLQGESCVIGMKEFLDEGDIRENIHHVDPAGAPILVDQRFGARNTSLADAFAFINSKKIYATFLGALQVAANGDLANWAVSDKQRYGAGGAMALVKGAKRVIICMIEEDKNGVSKLVEECTLPLTGEQCVDLVITDKGVYRPEGKQFKVLERFNIEKGIYEKLN